MGVWRPVQPTLIEAPATGQPPNGGSLPPFPKDLSEGETLAGSEPSNQAKLSFSRAASSSIDRSVFAGITRSTCGSASRMPLVSGS